MVRLWQLDLACWLVFSVYAWKGTLNNTAITSHLELYEFVPLHLCRPPPGLDPPVPASTQWLRQVQTVWLAAGFEGPNAGKADSSAVASNTVLQHSCALLTPRGIVSITVQQQPAHQVAFEVPDAGDRLVTTSQAMPLLPAVRCNVCCQTQAAASWR